MEYINIQKNISTSPRKLRLVADMVRKLNPSQALEILAFTNKAAALPLSKAIKTAMANAKGTDELFFRSLEVNEGSKYKRYRVGTAGRGRGRPYKKRLSHIKVILTDEIPNDKLQISNKRGKEKIEGRPDDSAEKTAVKESGSPESVR